MARAKARTSWAVRAPIRWGKMLRMLDAGYDPAVISKEVGIPKHTIQTHVARYGTAPTPVEPLNEHNEYELWHSEKPKLAPALLLPLSIQ